MSIMKLQKLCCYSQAGLLVWGDSPLFNEDFQAWGNALVGQDAQWLSQLTHMEAPKGKSIAQGGNPGQYYSQEA